MSEDLSYPLISTDLETGVPVKQIWDPPEEYKKCLPTQWLPDKFTVEVVEREDDPGVTIFKITALCQGGKSGVAFRVNNDELNMGSDLFGAHIGASFSAMIRFLAEKFHNKKQHELEEK